MPTVGVRTAARTLTDVVGKNFPTAGDLAAWPLRLRLADGPCLQVRDEILHVPRAKLRTDRTAQLRQLPYFAAKADGYEQVDVPATGLSHRAAPGCSACRAVKEPASPLGVPENAQSRITKTATPAAMNQERNPAPRTTGE